MRSFKEYILTESRWKTLAPKFTGDINSDEDVSKFLRSHGWENASSETINQATTEFRQSYRDLGRNKTSAKSFRELVKSGEISTAVGKAKKLKSGDYSEKIKSKASEFISTVHKLQEKQVVSEAVSGNTAKKTPADSDPDRIDPVLAAKLDKVAAELDSITKKEGVSLAELGDSADAQNHSTALQKLKDLLTELTNNREILPELSNTIIKKEISELKKSANGNGNPKVMDRLELRFYVFGDMERDTEPRAGRTMGIAVLWLNTMVPNLMKSITGVSGLGKISDQKIKDWLVDFIRELNGIKMEPELARQIGSLPADYDAKDVIERIKSFTANLGGPLSPEEAENFRKPEKPAPGSEPQNDKQKNSTDEKPLPAGAPDDAPNAPAGQSKDSEDSKDDETSPAGSPEAESSSSYKDYATRDPNSQLFGVAKLTFRNSLEDIEKAILHDFGSADGKTKGNILISSESIADWKRDENDKEYKNSKVNFESYNPVFSAVSKNKILSERLAIRGRINTSKEHTTDSWNRYKTEMGNTQRKYCNTAHRIIAKWDDQLTSTPDRKKIIDNLKLLSTKYSRELNRILKNAEKKNSYSEIGKIFHDVRDVAGSAKKFVGDKIKDSSAGRAAAYDAQQIKAAVDKVDISALRAAAEKSPQNFRTFAYAVRNPGYLENPDATTGDPKSKVTIGTIAGNIVTELGFQSDKESVKSFIKAFNQTYITKENMDSDITKLIMDKSAEYGKASTISVMIDDLQRIQKFSSSAVAKIQNLNKEGKGISSERALLTFIRNPSADLSKLQVSEMSFSEYYNILYEWKDAATRAQNKAQKAQDKADKAKEDADKAAAAQQKQAHRKEVLNWYKQNNKGYEKLRANLSDEELLTLATMLLLASKDNDIKSQAAAILQMREKDGKNPQDYLQAAANYSQEHPDIVSNIQKTLEKAFSTQAQQPQQNAQQPAPQSPQQPASQSSQPQQNMQTQNPQRSLGEVPSQSASVTTSSAGSYNIPDRLFKKMMRRKLGL